MPTTGFLVTFPWFLPTSKVPHWLEKPNFIHIREFDEKFFFSSMTRHRVSADEEIRMQASIGGTLDQRVQVCCY